MPRHFAIKYDSEADIAAGQAVQFTAVLYRRHRHEKIKRIRWHFSDGFKSRARAVTHGFEQPGKQRVKCVIYCQKPSPSYQVNKYVTRKKLIVRDEVDPDAVTLNLVNQSNDTNSLAITIFQKNVATVFNESAVAWTVVSLAPGANAPVTVNRKVRGAFDEVGPIDVAPGKLYSATTALTESGAASSPREIQILNSGLVNIVGKIYKNSKLLAVIDPIAPSTRGAFELRPTIWIGVATGVTQGQIMDSSQLSGFNTEISFLGIKSADIVIAGGGVGPSATPYQFSLANVVYS